MTANHIRVPEYQRPENLEAMLQFFAARLGPVEQREIADLELCDEPIVYIMGCARSGTTLVYQYLTQSGLFAYPSNFLSRFYYAPYLGAQLQKMLFDCDFRGEIDGGRAAAFISQLGKTQGALAPHEFWYFWRRFFAFGDTQQLSETELAAVDGTGFTRELRAMQTAFGKPLVLKGMILNWHLPYLAELYENSFFVIVERDTADNARSLLDARREFAGTETDWYSFKPPGWRDVLSLSPPEQTAWQVLATNAALKQGAAKIAPERVCRVTYEQFCTAPQKLLTDIAERCGQSLPHTAAELPAKFDVRRRQDGQDWQKIIGEVEPLIQPTSLSTT